MQRESPPESLSDAQFRMSSLMRFVTLVSAVSGYTELLRVMAEEARCTLVASTVSLSVWERQSGLLRTLVNAGELGPLEVEVPDDETYVLCAESVSGTQTLEGRGYVHTLGGSTDYRHLDRLLLESEKHSCLAVPVVSQGRVWGELWATRSAKLAPFSVDDLEIARLVSVHVGAGIAQVEHGARVKRLAFTDDLTGLANRRAFEERLERAVAEQLTSGGAVGVILLDLNGLKRINDARGHVAGDTALINFAGELSAAVSAVPNSLAARLGGDEFCILVVGASTADTAAAAAEVCRRAWSMLAEGVACGVANTELFDGVGATPSRLLRAADQAQYWAKAARSTVPVIAGSQPGESTTVAPAGWDSSADRAFRSRATLDQGLLVDTIVRQLDLTSDEDSLSRLRVVAHTLAESLEASRWLVSSLAPGSGQIVTAESGIMRPTPMLSGASTYEPMSYRFDQFPATSAAFEGQCIVVDVEDAHSDAAEVALLRTGGMSAMMMCGGIDGSDHRWLVEILGDQLTTPMRAYTSVLRAGIALALRRSVTSGGPAA